MEIIIGVIVLFVIVFAAWRWERGRAARAGREGERRVARELANLPRRNYKLLNDVLIPTDSMGGSSQIDHVIVSTRGIFVIETKRLSGFIRGSEYGQTWTQTTSHDGVRNFYNPLLQNEGHIRCLHRLLPGVDPDLFVSIVVFTDAKILEIGADDFVEERALLPDKRISRTLVPAHARKRWWQWGRKPVLDDSKIVTELPDLLDEIKRRPQVLDRHEVHEIAEAIEKSSDHSRRGHHDHNAYVKKVGREVAREIAHGICPRCGGQLEKRKGTNGYFLGCENYPSCRFTSPLRK